MDIWDEKTFPSVKSHSKCWAAPCKECIKKNAKELFLYYKEKVEKEHKFTNKVEWQKAMLYSFTLGYKEEPLHDNSLTEFYLVRVIEILMEEEHYPG